MKSLAAGLAITLTALSVALPFAAWATPGVGDAAPSFTLTGAEGKVYTLEELKGKRGVVLAWFPKPFTPG
jgi:peroxiredoxin Q/BCP